MNRNRHKLKESKTERKSKEKHGKKWTETNINEKKRKKFNKNGEKPIETDRNGQKLK